MPVRSAGRILGHHVTGQIDLDESQATLSVVVTHDTSTRGITKAQLAMVGHVELIELARRSRETLGAVPGHVLNSEQGSVGDKDVVQQSVVNDCPLRPLNDAGQDGQRRRSAGVLPQHAASTLGPLLDRGVDGFLDVGAVEVDLCAGGEVVKGAGKAEDVPEVGWCGEDLVDVEGGVDEGHGGEDVVPEGTFWPGEVDVWWGGEGTLGREGAV